MNFIKGMRKQSECAARDLVHRTIQLSAHVAYSTVILKLCEQSTSATLSLKATYFIGTSAPDMAAGNWLLTTRIHRLEGNELSGAQIQWARNSGCLFLQ
jgi:hypothetical protein